ncbi:MAG: radical SAM protein, partial [Treponema sp.]|nr:radical SAM protein [Treponema sp.]
SQYTPINRGGKPGSKPERFLSEKEYDTVIGWLGEFGIEDGFCQELVTGSDWLPDFNRRNPFSSELSVTVWHFSEGQRP